MVKEAKPDDSDELRKMILESGAYTEKVDVGALSLALHKNNQIAVAEGLAIKAKGRALTEEDEELFYNILYILIFISSSRLLYDFLI